MMPVLAVETPHVSLSICDESGGIWVGSFLMFTIHHSIPWLAFFLLETISAFGLAP